MNKDKSILLVEDDESLRELVSMVLELESYQVIVVENGQKAIAYLNDNEVDLVILDLFMPVMDGTFVLNWLRNEKKLTMPVLVMSAQNDDKTRQKMLSGGADGFLDKPLDISNILSAVNNLIH